MKTTPILVLVCVFVCSSAAQAKRPRRKKISVTVVDVAGGLIYVRPGAAAGLRVGRTVLLGNRRHKVVAITETNAALARRQTTPTLGARGSAIVRPPRVEGQALPVPEPLDTYEGLWTAAKKPALSQKPKHIPLAASQTSGPSNVVLETRASAIVPDSSKANRVGRASVRGQVHITEFRGTPLGFDADIEVGRWFGRGLRTGPGSSSRPLIEVQELQLTYGGPERLGIGLGRLHHAGAMTGLLDGVRIHTGELGNFTLYGFGGVVPDTLDGKPSFDLTRFGAGILYRNFDSDLRPSGELGVYASTFDGSVDERRLVASGRITPGKLNLAAQGEFSMFSSDNPWGASAVELTNLGVDASYHKGASSTTASISVQQPERSRWLASLLPPEWLCTAEPAEDPTTETCDRQRNYRTFALLSSTYRLGDHSLRVGGTSTIGRDLNMEALGIFADGSFALTGATMVQLSALFSDADLVRITAGRIGLSHLFTPNVDTSIFYRPAINSYQASIDTILEHRAGIELGYQVTPRLFVTTTVEGLETTEIRYVAGFASVVWRPAM